MVQGLAVMPWESEQHIPCADIVSEPQDKSVKKSRVTGSRRIFSPLFKIQVLDSYRQDIDCRGNQRATARKYNIHRRQIQKWLQCEQHLRSCVSEDMKSGCSVPNPVLKTNKVVYPSGLRETNTDIHKGDEVETDSSLNRIYCRLPDAVSRTGEDSTPLASSQTKVFNDKPILNTNISSKLEAQTLKLVAQKLYPRSPSTQCENIEKFLTPTSLVSGPKLSHDSHIFQCKSDVKIVSKFEQPTPYLNTRDKVILETGNESQLLLDKNYNELYPSFDGTKSDSQQLVPLNLENKTEQTVPKDDLTNEIFPDVFDKNSLNFEQSCGPDNLIQVNNNDKITNNFGVALSEQGIFTNEGQKFCDVEPAPLESSCLVEQVPTSSSTVPLDSVNTLVPSCVDVAASKNTDSVLSNFPSSDITVSNHSSSLGDVILPGNNVFLENNLDEARVPTPKVECPPKSIISPKRKWIQESLQENQISDLSEPIEKIPKKDDLRPSVLPLKQRVKLDLRSKTCADLEKPETTEKHISPNFTIERLCSSPAKDPVKPEITFTPLSFSSPSSYSITSPPDYYRSAEPSPYPYDPNYYHYGAAYPPAIGPPLYLQHRTIPELVPLHFKPEILQTDSKMSVSPNCTTCLNHSTNFSCYTQVSQTQDLKNGFPLKEEKLSDVEENVDIDITSTTPVENKTFDFGPPTGKRRSFSVQFKLSVLDAFYNDKDCSRNQRATARKYNINRRQVQKWLSQENELRNEGSVKNGKYLQRQRLGNENRDNVNYPEHGRVLGECKQCPQHCVNNKNKRKQETDPTSDRFSPALKNVDENENKNYNETDCFTKTKDAIFRSTKNLCQFGERPDYLCNLDKSNVYESCGFADNYRYQGYADNLSVHFYPYNSVCDWSNLQAYSSQYPCLFPVCRPNIGRV